jgi:hypothetical protein
MTKVELVLEVERLTKENQRLRESVEIFKEGFVTLGKFANNPAVEIVDMQRFEKIEKFREKNASQKAFEVKKYGKSQKKSPSSLTIKLIKANELEEDFYK